MTVWDIYLKVADLSEATLSPDHALDIAEWVATRYRPSLWQRVSVALFGHSPAAWEALAVRERWAREGWMS